MSRKAHCATSFSEWLGGGLDGGLLGGRVLNLGALLLGAGEEPLVEWGLHVIKHTY